MLKFVLWVVCHFVFIGCSSPQLIRATNYYPAYTGIIHEKEINRKYYAHHPAFAGTKSLSTEGPANYSQWLNYYLFGWISFHQPINIAQACGTKPFRQAYVANDIPQGLITILTLGLYSPRTIEVWCGSINAN